MNGWKTNLQDQDLKNSEAEKKIQSKAKEKDFEESVCMRGWTLIQEAYLPSLQVALVVSTDV